MRRSEQWMGWSEWWMVRSKWLMGRSKRWNGVDRMERVMDDTEQANNVMEQAWIGWSKQWIGQSKETEQLAPPLSNTLNLLIQLIQITHHLGTYHHRSAIETFIPRFSFSHCSSWYSFRICNNAFCRANVLWRMWLWLGFWIVEDHCQ